MNDDQINDLKQLIATTVQQAVKQEITEAEVRIIANLGGQIEALDAKVDDLREEMRDGFAGVGDAFAPANDQIEDHEKRITTLEQQAA
jgi:hypothetical protein